MRCHSIRRRTTGDRAATVRRRCRPNARPAPILDAADVSLALRYLTDFEVLVAVHASADLLAEAVAAAAWTGARLVLVVEPETDVPAGVPADALVVAAAADDADGVGTRIGAVRSRPGQGRCGRGLRD